MRTKRWVAATLLALTAILAVGLWRAAGELTRPARTAIGAPPPGVAGREVAFPADGIGTVRGWFLPGTPGKGAVLLLHGIHGNRQHMLPRAQFLHQRGFGILAVDLPSHGESDGDAITAGAREGQGVLGALNFLRREARGERIGAIGSSLGGASLVLSKAPDIDAIVLESVYATIDDALRTRIGMMLGSWAEPFTPLLTLALRLRVGVAPADLRPIERIGALGKPLLLIHGDLDQHTSIEEARRLFAAAREPKEMWVVLGQAHVDMYAALGETYEQRVLAFLTPLLQRK